MDAALEDIEFLARSANRVRMLEAVDSGPCDRTDLQAATGISRTTIGRVLGEFESLGWIARNGRNYESTPLGSLLVTEFASLVETAAMVRKLRPVIRWLPVEAFDFDLARFADAEITFASATDVIAPVRRLTHLLEREPRVRILAPLFAPEPFEAHWRATVQGTQTSEDVITADVFDVIISDPETARMLEGLVASGRGAVFRHEGPAPCGLVLGDGRAAITVVDDHEAPQALIETTDEAIRSWIASTIDAYRQESVQIDLDAITA